MDSAGKMTSDVSPSERLAQLADESTHLAKPNVLNVLYAAVCFHGFVQIVLRDARVLKRVHY